MNGSLQHLMAIAYIYIIIYRERFQVAIRIVSVSLLAAFRGSKNYQRIRFDGGSCKPQASGHPFSKAPAKPSHQNPT